MFKGFAVPFSYLFTHSSTQLSSITVPSACVILALQTEQIILPVFEGGTKVLDRIHRKWLLR